MLNLKYLIKQSFHSINPVKMESNTSFLYLIGYIFCQTQFIESSLLLSWTNELHNFYVRKDNLLKILTTFFPIQFAAFKGVRIIAFNATFKIIAVISWRSFLLVEETAVPGENHRPTASHWQTLSHNIASSIPHLSRIRTHSIRCVAFKRVVVIYM